MITRKSRKLTIILSLLLIPLTHQPSAEVIPISTARGTQDEKGVRVPSTESDITVSGICTVSDGIMLVSTVYDYTSLYIQDNTGGINVYKGREGGPRIADFNGTPRYVQEGDSVTITGKIMQYCGNMEIADPPLTIIVHSTGNALPVPIKVTCKDIAEESKAVSGSEKYGGEIYEGKMIYIENVKIKSIFITKGGPSVTINDGTSDLTMFIYNMTDIVRENVTLPSGNTPLTITGIAGQYAKGGNSPGDATAWLKRYQILVRKNADIVPNPSKTGSIEIPNRVYHTESDVATIYIYDANVPGDTLNIVSTVTVKVTSENDPQGFVITATETAKNTFGVYSFQLGISKTNTDTTTYPPKIWVTEDGIITLTYYDQQNENGIPYTTTYNAYFKPLISGTQLVIPKRVFSVEKGERCEIRFNTVFNTEVNARANYRVTVRVFDLYGREIKRLIDNVYTDIGTVYWDGTDDHGTVVPIGTYIVHVMARDLYGVKMDEKMQTVAVATKLN